MKILIATKEKQTEKDFYWTEDGEIVKFPFVECDNHCNCGCDRSWVGTKSSKSTTTAKVVKSELPLVVFVNVLYNSLIKEGWDKISPKDKLLNQCLSHAMEIQKIAKKYKIGTILRRQGNRVFDAK